MPPVAAPLGVQEDQGAVPPAVEAVGLAAAGGGENEEGGVPPAVADNIIDLQCPIMFCYPTDPVLFERRIYCRSALEELIRRSRNGFVTNPISRMNYDVDTMRRSMIDVTEDVRTRIEEARDCEEAEAVVAEREAAEARVAEAEARVAEARARVAEARAEAAEARQHLQHDGHVADGVANAVGANAAVAFNFARQGDDHAEVDIAYDNQEDEDNDEDDDDDDDDDDEGDDDDDDNVPLGGLLGRNNVRPVIVHNPAHIPEFPTHPRGGWGRMYGINDPNSKSCIVFGTMCFFCFAEQATRLLDVLSSLFVPPQRVLQHARQCACNRMVYSYVEHQYHAERGCRMYQTNPSDTPRREWFLYAGNVGYVVHPKVLLLLERTVAANLDLFNQPRDDILYPWAPTITYNTTPETQSEMVADNNAFAHIGSNGTLIDFFDRRLTQLSNWLRPHNNLHAVRPHFYHDLPALLFFPVQPIHNIPGVFWDGPPEDDRLDERDRQRVREQWQRKRRRLDNYNNTITAPLHVARGVEMADEANGEAGDGR